MDCEAANILEFTVLGGPTSGALEDVSPVGYVNIEGIRIVAPKSQINTI